MVPVLVDAHDYQRRAYGPGPRSREPNPIHATPGRGPYVLGSLAGVLPGHLQARRLSPSRGFLRRSLIVASPSPHRHAKARSVCPQPKGSRRSSGRCMSVGARIRGATSPGPIAPTDRDSGGRRRWALWLSAPRAASLMPSTIQQLSGSPTRNSGTTYFLRKAGLSGPT